MAISTSTSSNNFCKECGRDFDILDHLNQRWYCGPCEKRKENNSPTHARASDCKSCSGFWRDCPVCKKAKEAVKANRKNADGEAVLEKLIKERAKQEQEENTVGLKLFEVTLSGHMEYMVRKKTTVVILATSETHAREHAIGHVINDPRGMDLQVEVQEVTGPFGNGRILSRRNF